MPETIFVIEFIEIGDHVLCLVFAVVNFLNAVENADENNFVAHDACFFKEMFVTLLYTFYRVFQHMFWFAVNTDTDRQSYLPAACLFEQRKQPMPCWPCLPVLVRYLLRIDLNILYIFFFKLVRSFLTSFNNNQSFIYLLNIHYFCPASLLAVSRRSSGRNLSYSAMLHNRGLHTVVVDAFTSLKNRTKSSILIC